MRWFLTISLALLAWNCATPVERSNIKIAHGYVIEESEHPAVIILRQTTDGRGSSCTGTFVGPNTIATASHCVRSGIVNYKTHRPQHPITNRDYNGGVNEHDFALLVFENDIAPAVMPVSTRAPEMGEEFLLVGYGQNRVDGYNSQGRPVNGRGAGIKRKATGNQYLRVDERIVIYGDLATDESPGEKQPTSLSGDSGGPFIINNTIAGVVSGGGPSRVQGQTVKTSNYVNLNGASAKRFMQAVLADAAVGAKIEFASPDGPTSLPRLDTMFLAMGFSGSNAVLQMSARTEHGAQKVALCFETSQACARDFFSTDRKLFYTEMSKTGSKGAFDLFRSAPLNLNQAAYTLTSIALDSNGRVVNSRSFILSK